MAYTIPNLTEKGEREGRERANTVQRDKQTISLCLLAPMGERGKGEGERQLGGKEHLECKERN